MRGSAWASFAFLAALGLAPVAGQAAPGDLVFERQGEGEIEGAAAFPPSIFPHWIHRIRYRCYVCHPAPFEMKLGANPVTMKDIGEGRFCGACHDGTRAFAAEFQNCQRCHKESEE